MVVFAACDMVTFELDHVRFAHTSVVVPEVVTVHVPEPESKNTLSDDVGTAAPPAPPLDVAHLEPAVPSHVAVPPHLLLPFGGRTASDSSHRLRMLYPVFRLSLPFRVLSLSRSRCFRLRLVTRFRASKSIRENFNWAG